MVTQGNIRGGQQGVTLIELMVGAVVATTVIAAGYAVLTSSSKALTTNEQTIETQQNVRMAMEFLFRDIRQAGFGMNGSVGNCSTAIVPADNTPTGPDRGPDRISMVVPVGNPVGTVTDPPWILNSDTTAGFNLLALPSARRGHQYGERSGRKPHGAECDHFDRRGDHHDGDRSRRRQPDGDSGSSPGRIEAKYTDLFVAMHHLSNYSASRSDRPLRWPVTVPGSRSGRRDDGGCVGLYYGREPVHIHCRRN